MQVFYIKVTIKQAYACVSRTRVEPYSCRHALRTSEKKKTIFNKDVYLSGCRWGRLLVLCCNPTRCPQGPLTDKLVTLIPTKILYTTLQRSTNHVSILF